MTDDVREENLRVLTEEMETPLAAHIREELAEGFQRRLWSDRAVMPREAPSSFVYLDLPEASPTDLAIAKMRASGAEHTGWPDAMPKPIVKHSVTFRMHVDEAVGMGLIAPPEGWEPTPLPPIPWRTRIRMRISRACMRIRMRMASALAGFDVEDRDA